MADHITNPVTSALPALIRLVSLLTWIVLAGSGLGLGVFLYFNLYQTITQADQIILLRREVAPETVDTKKVEAVCTAIDQKTSGKSTVDWNTLPDPFRAHPESIQPVPPPLIPAVSPIP